MIKEFRSKNNDVRLIIDNCLFGLGIHLDLISPIAHREKVFQLSIDFFFIRFWWARFKRIKTVNRP